jgi:hypothetical protein
VGIERGEYVAQVDRVLAVSVEVRPNSQSRGRDAVDHERKTGRSKLLPLNVTSCGLSSAMDQLLLCPLTNVGGTERVHRPMIALAVSDERADA